MKEGAAFILAVALVIVVCIVGGVWLEVAGHKEQGQSLMAAPVVVLIVWLILR